MSEQTIPIPGRLKNVAIGGHVAGSEDIDAGEGKTQKQVNDETNDTLALHQSEISGLNSQNYVSVSSYSSLPATGSADTIYRVSSWDGNANSGEGAADVTKYTEYAWNGTAYIVLDVKTQIGEVFDISEYKAIGGTLATFENLSAALDNGNNVPAGIRKGGMSVKFVQSSDNKYVQFRCMADEWSINTEDWAIADEGVYVENPEFVRVVLDNEGKILEAVKVNGTKLLPAGVEINEKIDFEGNETTVIENPEFVEVKLDSTGHILWGIQKDGNVYFGAGVPKQVIDYIEEKIADLSLDEYEDIVAFLNNLEKGDKTLQTLLNEKVDKVEGKSLIDAEYASSQSAIDNPEYIQVITDSNFKVLQGIKSDGTSYIGENLQVEGQASIKKNAVVKGDLELTAGSIQPVNNPEYLKVTTDAQGKILNGIKKDGSQYFSSDVDIKGRINNRQIQELEKTKALVDGQEESKKINSLKKVYDYLKGLPNSIKGKKVSIIGDSISTFEGYIPDGYATWYPVSNTEDRSYDVRTVEDTWWKQVIDDTENLLEVNASYSGSTASNLSIGFSSRVNLLGNPDVIFIALGSNDSSMNVEIGDINFDASVYDLSKFAPAYIKGVKDTIVAYPSAKIICMAFDMDADYYNVIEAIAKYYGCTYIYVGDISDVHPNKEEMTAVAEKIYQYFYYILNDELKAIKDTNSFTNNPEYIQVTTDGKNKILAGRTPDGAAFEKVGFSTPKMSLDGHSIKNIEDPEGRSEITTYSDGKIISYRDADGVKHENTGLEAKDVSTENISAKHYNYSEKNLLDLMNELYSRNFGGTYDLRLPQLRVTSDLLTVNGDDIIGLNITKNKVQCEFQFISQSLSFIEKGTIAYQGNSTLYDRKKNFSINFTNKHRFGKWLAMDGFQCKAYYTFKLHVRDIVSNRFIESVYNSRNVGKVRPFNNYNDFPQNSVYNDIDGGALCHVDGFPVEIFINNAYWGVYLFNIKKDRRNYLLGKNNVHHIQVEAANDTYYTNAYMANGGEGWANLEIRNPKKDSGNTSFDEGEEPNTGEVKLAWQDFISKLNAVTNETTVEELGSFLNIDEWVDAIIIMQLLWHQDSWCKNNLYTTWDCVINGNEITAHWSPLLYDMDQCIWGNTGDPFNNKAYEKCPWLVPIMSVLNTKIRNRYKELRDSGVVSEDTIREIIEEIVSTIGYDAYEDERTRWGYDDDPYAQPDSTKLLVDNFGIRIDYLDNLWGYTN